ncbi:hypothetical protein CDD83_11062 [Cordyceps sp. RAO-2017]|nr:hypothetical protein CDD83_11062 [Cordyceps sp. RAO-2017]
MRDLSLELATRTDIYRRFEQVNLELPVSRVAKDLRLCQVGAAPLLTRWSPSSLSVFPFDQQLGAAADPDGLVALVDVGGGFGHQCLRLPAAFPQLQDRLVLHD